MNNSVFRKLKGLIVLGVLVAFFVGLNVSIRRFHYEQQFIKPEIAVSHNEIEKLALLSEVSIKQVLSDIQTTAPLNYLSIEEETLTDYISRGAVSVLKGSEIMNMYRVGHVNRFLLTHLYKQVKVKPERIYLIIDQKNDYETIRDFLRIIYGKSHVKRIGQMNILEVTADLEVLLEVGLGVSEHKINTALTENLVPIIRLKNEFRVSAELVRHKFASFTSLIQEGIVVFEGDTVLGYPNFLGVTLDKIRSNNLQVGTVEFFKQAGMSTLSKAIPDRVVRVHSIGEREQEGMSKQKAISRYVRAANERAINVLLVHPFFNVFMPDSLIGFNLNYIRAISDGLKVKSYAMFQSSGNDVFEYQPIRPFELYALSLGAVLILLSLLHMVFLFRLRIWVYSAIIFHCVFYLSYLWGSLSLWSQVMAFFIATLAPILAIVTQFPKEREMGTFRFVSMVGFLLKMLGICLIGAVLVVGLLSDYQFLVGVERFWGVKLSFLIPVILIGMYFYLRPHRISSLFYVARRIYSAPVQTAGLISIIACGVFVMVLIIRSSNFSVIPQLGMEQKIRSLLEHYLYIRPRTKEFLIGYPLLMIAFLEVDRRLSRQWLWFFILLGSVAPISVINSFCHLHTPLYVSLYRSVLGLVLGILVGCGTYFLYTVFSHFYRRRFGS